MIWLPFANVKANIDVLTDAHICDVVFEGMQCLRDIHEPSVAGRDERAWRNHPAGLLFYIIAAEAEMRRRGMDGEPRVFSAFTWISRRSATMSPQMPSWYGDPAFHESQRSHLIRVNPLHYARRLPPTTRLELPVIWPSERKVK